jgi:hypothetical protein
MIQAGMPIPAQAALFPYLDGGSSLLVLDWDLDSALARTNANAWSNCKQNTEFFDS